MPFLYSLTAFLVLVSLFRSSEKTLSALRMTVKKILRFFLPFIIMLVMVSIILSVIPERLITRYLVEGNRFADVLIASLLGSVTMMPGFIAFPLAGILLKKGVPYMVLSALTTTLMMVGVLTYPVEKEYFGMKVTILRNVISFFIALAVAFMTGVFFGEVL